MHKVFKYAHLLIQVFRVATAPLYFEPGGTEAPSPPGFYATVISAYGCSYEELGGSVAVDPCNKVRSRALHDLAIFLTQ